MTTYQNKKITDIDMQFVKLACNLAFDNIANGGGPFGAVIVKDNNIIATGTNTVTLHNDPTAHAEINAIRSACKKLRNFKLNDCIVYCSCEPCPMCLSALYWAGVKKIIYCNTKADAAAINFDDSFIYDEIELAPEDRHIPCIHMQHSDAPLAFQAWASKADKITY